MPQRPHRPRVLLPASRSRRCCRSRPAQVVTTACSRRSTGPGRAPPRRPVEPAPRGLSMPAGVSRGRLPALTRIVAATPRPSSRRAARPLAGKARRLAALRRSRLRARARRSRGRRDLAPVAVPPLRLHLAAGSRTWGRRRRRGSTLRAPTRVARLLPPAARRETGDGARRHASTRRSVEQRQRGARGVEERRNRISDRRCRHATAPARGVHAQPRTADHGVVPRPRSAHRLAHGSQTLLRPARRRRRRQQRRQLAVGRRHRSEPARRTRVQPAQAGTPLRPRRRRTSAATSRSSTAIEGQRGSRAVEAPRRTSPNTRHRSSIAPEMRDALSVPFRPCVPAARSAVRRDP